MACLSTDEEMENESKDEFRFRKLCVGVGQNINTGINHVTSSCHSLLRPNTDIYVKTCRRSAS